MNISLNAPPPAIKRTGHLVNPCAIIVIAIALLVILGWLFEIEPLKRGLPHLNSMKFNTALCFLLAGTALLWRQYAIIRMTLGLTIAIFGAVTLDQFTQNADFGIDQFFMKHDEARVEFPGRPAPITALGMVLSGLALLFINAHNTFWLRIAEIMAISVAIFGLLALTGYAVSSQMLYRLPGFTSISLPTAVGQIFLGIGIVSALPENLLALIISSWKTYRAMWLGFGFLIFWLIASSILSVSHIVATDKINTVRSFQLDIISFALNLKTFNKTKNPAYRLAATEDSINIDQDLAEYGTMAVSKQEFDWFDRVTYDWQALKKSGAALIANEHKPTQDQLNQFESDQLRLEKWFERPAQQFKEADFKKKPPGLLPLFNDTETLLFTLLALGAILSFTASGYVMRALQRKESERFASENRLRKFYESGVIGVIHWTTGGKITDANDKFLDMIGYTRDDLVAGRIDWLQMTPPEFRYLDEQSLAELKLKGISNLFEKEYIRKDGSRIPVMLAGAMLDDSFNEGIGFVLDNTERKRMEMALRASERHFQTLADDSPVLIWVNGDEGRKFVNRPYIEFVGATQDSDWQGYNWMQYLHPDDRDNYLAAYKKAYSSQTPFKAQFRFRHHSGEYRWMKSVALPHYLSDGSFQGYVGCILDITDLKEAEAGLREADYRKNEFLAMLGHELRNPLTPITAAVAILDNPDIDKQTLTWVCSVLERNLAQVNRLLNDLLDVSRITRGLIKVELERTDLVPVLQESVASVLAAMQSKDQTFHFNLPATPLYLAGDRLRLVQVFANLLNNANKYTGKGGHIELKVSSDDRSLWITLQDNGMGLSPKLKPYVFDLFAQGERSIARSEGGLGIGLTLVKKLVELHGGQISADSPGEDQGSTFTVQLPRLVEAAQPDEVKPQPAQSKPGQGLRVLLIDDNADVLSSVALWFEHSGCQVETRLTGTDGILAAQDFKPEVILVDIGLPDLDGYQVARKLREQPDAKHALIAAMSGYAPSTSNEDVAVFDHYLIKPINLSDLQNLIGNHPPR